MTKNARLGLAAGLLAAFASSAKAAQAPLCEVGSSVVDLMYLQSTGAGAQIEPAILRASLLFLRECPTGVTPALRQLAAHEAEFRRAWIQALRSAVRDTANSDVRILLSLAKVSVARSGDRSLKEYLGPAFDGVADVRAVDPSTVGAVLEDQAKAILRDYVTCDGVGCLDASDNLLFLLGTHPVPLLKAMRADSVAAKKWLRLIPDESFSGPPERSKSREAARRAVLKKLSDTKPAGFERELRASEKTLRAIRYQSIQ